MPEIGGVAVLRAWRHRGEEGRIHYIVSTADGNERRLWEQADSEWGQVLELALQDLGYSGPMSQ